VFFKSGSSSSVLHTILNTVPATACATGHANGTFTPVGTILPNTNLQNEWWTYDGSLTTPGCDPVVTFLIFKAPFQVSSTDRDRLKTIFGPITARHLQRQALPVKKTWH
jgi:carbonic anhydrase